MRATLLLLTALPILLAACESDFTADRNNPQPAVQSPVEGNDTAGEIQGRGAVGVPILSVTAPNNKDEKPTVQAITDPLTNSHSGPQTPADVKPAVSPDAQPTSPRTVDSITGQ